MNKNHSTLTMESSECFRWHTSITPCEKAPTGLWPGNLFRAPIPEVLRFRCTPSRPQSMVGVRDDTLHYVRSVQHHTEHKRARWKDNTHNKRKWRSTRLGGARVESRRCPPFCVVFPRSLTVSWRIGRRTKLLNQQRRSWLERWRVHWFCRCGKEEDRTNGATKRLDGTYGNCRKIELIAQQANHGMAHMERSQRVRQHQLISKQLRNGLMIYIYM